jgi:pimeloyl-ACP methyl ester carboxylesterase
MLSARKRPALPAMARIPGRLALYAAAMLALECVGDGPGDPLVLVHGSGTSGAIWRRAMPLLARDGRRVVAPDLPGYGRSPAAGRGFALDAVAGALADGLDEAGVRAPYDLVGHSMGGAIALLLAAHRPQAVRRLVLVAPAGLAALPTPVAALLGAVAAPYAVARRRLATPLLSSPTVRRLALAGVARDGASVPAEHARAALASSAGATRIGPGLASAAAADLRGELKSVRGPIGLVWGEHDPIIPRKRIDVIRAVRGDVVLRLVPGTAHAPMLECPEAFMAALEDVLAALTG